MQVPKKSVILHWSLGSYRHDVHSLRSTNRRPVTEFEVQIAYPVADASLVPMDYLIGVASAFRTKTVSSNEGYMWLVKKASIFLIAIIAAQIDKVTGNGTSLFRNCTAFFFVANDALSTLENVSEMGVQLPGFLKGRS